MHIPIQASPVKRKRSYTIGKSIYTNIRMSDDEMDDDEMDDDEMEGDEGDDEMDDGGEGDEE